MRANPALNAPPGPPARRPTAVAAACAAFLAFAGCKEPTPRAAAMIPNQAARRAVVQLVDGVPHISNPAPPFFLQLDSVLPDGPARLLFFQGRPVYRDSAGDVYAVDRWDRLLWVDRRLRGQSIPRPRDAATLLRIDASGALAEWLATLDAGLTVSLVGSNGLRLARSPEETGLIARDASGDTLWASEHGPGDATDRTHRVIALGMGPDGALYALADAGENLHVDVTDARSGELTAMAELHDPTPTLASDRAGRVYVVDDFIVLTGLAPAGRRAFARFDLTRMAGGSMSSGDLTDRVTLVNLWASWCAPCREELPALARLADSIDDPDFLFVTMNEDVSGTDAVFFVKDLDFRYPVLMGAGRLRRRFRYFGLPYTALVDRRGRIVMEWSGYGGPQQIRDVRALILEELARASP